jgi:hypothetical protein
MKIAPLLKDEVIEEIFVHVLRKTRLFRAAKFSFSFKVALPNPVL